MIISRAKSGFFIIGGSAILFGLDVFLTDETAMQITMLAPVQNFLFFVSIVMLIGGIYLIVSSNPALHVAKKFIARISTANIADGFLKFHVDRCVSLLERK